MQQVKNREQLIDELVEDDPLKNNDSSTEPSLRNRML